MYLIQINTYENSQPSAVGIMGQGWQFVSARQIFPISGTLQTYKIPFLVPKILASQHPIQNTPYTAYGILLLRAP